MSQYGFLIDLSRCIGCNACVISCKQWHGISPGPVKWMRVYQWEKGSFPEIDLRVLPIPCFHCETPVCADACPNKAIYKEEKYGAVLVDPSKCTGERKCWEACPYGAPQFPGDEPGLKMSKCNMCIDRLEMGLKPICVLSCSMRALEFGPIDELIKKYGSKQDKVPVKDCSPCRITCPAGIDAESYIELASVNKFDEALDLIRETTPLAGVLGRICTHPCETACQRGKFDDPLPIRSLKRFVADEAAKLTEKPVIPVPKIKDRKVAIVGSGPAGLQCAYDLARSGYPVTVFEAAPEIGGMLRYGIPEYRLPKEVLDNEASYIEKLGVEYRTGMSVTSFEEIFSQGFQAVFVATGARQSIKLEVEGEDAKGVFYALDYLEQANSGKKVNPGKHVVVIGGGSVAIDAARTSVRLGAQQVHLICLECRDLSIRDRMPAQDQEIEEAEKEGVIIHPCFGVYKILTSGGKVAGIQAVACISVRDDHGNFAPKFAEDVSPTINADTVIIAIGQTVQQSTLLEHLKKTGPGTINVDPVTLQTSDKRIFAGGDAVSGSLDVVSAIAHGKAAAISIDRYLQGRNMEEGRQTVAKSIRENLQVQCMAAPTIDLVEREFMSEVELPLQKDTALGQASRCLHCGKTVPSVVFKRELPKKQIIYWDFVKTLELWQNRHPEGEELLPSIFSQLSDATYDSVQFGGRKNLGLKAKTVEELMTRTTDDE